jgi:hypothetical protein
VYFDDDEGGREGEQYHVKSEIALRLHHYETLKRLSSEIKKWLNETVGHFPLLLKNTTSSAAKLFE